MKKNKTGLLKGLTKNWGLKLVSFLFAIALWLMVVNVNDPTITYSFNNVPVTIENADTLTAQGKIFEVLDGTDTVGRVTITAPKSIIQNIEKSDIIASADMKTLTSAGTVNIDYAVSRYSSMITSIRGNIDCMEVYVENKISSQLILDTVISGNAPDGYEMGNVSTDQNLIMVSGPESLVDQVASARVEVDMTELSGFTSDINTSAQVHLYDAEDREIVADNLIKTPESVMINIEILAVKEVPLYYSTDGISTTPADGYKMTGVNSLSENTVKIVGRKAAIGKVSEVTIPADAVDLTGATETVSTNLKLRNYLPDGVSIASSGKNSVTVEVGVEQVTSKDLTLKTSALQVFNVPDGIEAQLDEMGEEITVHLSGVRSEMEAINARTFIAGVDVAKWMENQDITDLQPGRYAVELNTNLPSGVALSEPLTGVLVVSVNEQQETDAEENTTENSRQPGNHPSATEKVQNEDDSAAMED